MIECLPAELNQVFLNIIINAVHAIQDAIGREAGDEKGLIEIKTHNLGNNVQITISDSGTGIPEAAQSRVFDPFFTTKEVGRGTGQGLSIAHHVVVNKHHGSIRFKTEIGKGTTFIIDLPAKATTSALIP
jgi:signal transduction histidine kinase